MIDYFSHVSALRVCLSAMASSPPADPAHPAAVADALAAASSEPGSAILGALTDHLLQYSQAVTSKEIGILAQATALFEQGLTTYGQLSAIRTDLETGLTTPTAPGALAAYNAALAALLDIQPAIQNLRGKIEAFQASYSNPWIAPVGQQQDAPVSQWAWRDVFLARRTTAFVANAQNLATTAQQRAFAIGALAGAAGNLLGSGYLNSVVGGPRRSHQLRQRLAAYSVGAWLRDNEPLLAGSLSSIRIALTFGQAGTPVLPADLKTLIEDTLRHTYPSGTAALPDLDLAYSNLMTHLSLLQGFTLPPVPPPVNNTLTAEILGGFGTLTDDDNVTPSGPGLGTNWPGIGPNESAGAVCATLLLWLLWPFAAVVALDNALSGPGQGPQSTGTDEEGLVAASQSPAALGAFNTIYGLQMSAWEALAAARTALVLRGLLYPDPDDLSNPTFTQFLTIPASIGPYPLLPMPSSDDGTAWPASALEQNGTTASPYTASSSPLTFLTGSPAYSVSALSPTLWTDLIERPGETHESKNWPGDGNFNLDCDRGFQALCWALAPGTAITSQPVDTVVLSFTGI
jgi:hypothetical protein